MNISRDDTTFTRTFLRVGLLIVYKETAPVPQSLACHKPLILYKINSGAAPHNNTRTPGFAQTSGFFKQIFAFG